MGSLVEWTEGIFVVDSGSTDHTLAIAQSYRAQLYHHPFETHAKQWKWALENLPITTDWVLALDADQSITTELREEISNFLQKQSESSSIINGCYVRRRQ